MTKREKQLTISSSLLITVLLIGLLYGKQCDYFASGYGCRFPYNLPILHGIRGSWLNIIQTWQQFSISGVILIICILIVLQQTVKKRQLSKWLAMAIALPFLMWPFIFITQLLPSYQFTALTIKGVSTTYQAEWTTPSPNNLAGNFTEMRRRRDSHNDICPHQLLGWDKAEIFYYRAGCEGHLFAYNPEYQSTNPVTQLPDSLSGELLGKSEQLQTNWYAEVEHILQAKQWAYYLTGSYYNLIVSNDRRFMVIEVETNGDDRYDLIVLRPK